MSEQYEDYRPPIESWEVADKLADALYIKGYRDAMKELDSDARGSEEWQEVYDAIRRQGKYKGMIE